VGVEGAGGRLSRFFVVSSPVGGTRESGGGEETPDAGRRRAARPCASFGFVLSFFACRFRSCILFRLSSLVVAESKKGARRKIK